MTELPPTPERLAGFSDGVIAVIITIMVLELKAPHDANWNALLALWPIFVSYGLSYLFVGVFWANHHHLLRDARVADHKLVGANLLALFFVSLIPFFTAFMAENRMAAFATALYAGVFLLSTVGYVLLQKAVTAQAQSASGLRRIERAADRRNWISLAAFALAIPSAYLHPALSFLIIILGAILYFIPDAVFRI